MKSIMIAILGILIFFGVVVGGSFFGLWHYSFFGPKYENVRRETFQNTRSYNEGKIQDLTRYRLQYLQEKDEESKKAIKSTVLMMYADYPRDRLPLELKTFLRDLESSY